MALPSISGVGRLTADPDLRYSPNGVAVLTVNLAFNSRRFNKQTQEWEDGDVFFIRGTAFKQLAENAAESLQRGTEVHVTGRMKTDQWEDRQSGEKRSAPSLLIDSLGPNLAYATAKVTKVSRSAGDTSGGSTDPWGAAPAASGGPVDDEPPF
jgi:single-strand DNA-binding protein